MSEGKYIAKQDAARCLTLTAPGGEPQTWVPDDLFMAVQKERDDYRRTLALIGAWRVSGMSNVNDLDRLLRDAGFDHDANLAMLGILQWVLESPRPAAPAAPTEKEHQQP